MRACTGCGVSKAASDFHDSNRRSGVRVDGEFKQSRCKDCQTQDKGKYRDRNRMFLTEMKLKVGCADCGFRSSAVALDFHHTGHKRFALSSRKALQSTLDSLLKEIAVCVVLCANCHRIRHHGGGEHAAH